MRRWPTYEVAHAELAALPSADRIPALLTEWQAETISLQYDEIRRLFVLAWDGGADVPTDLDHDVLRMLRWIAPVRDSDARLYGPLTIYRPADGNGRAIRWTLDQANVASASGVSRATVQSSDVLAHLTSGGNQVLVDPDELANVGLL